MLLFCLIHLIRCTVVTAAKRSGNNCYGKQFSAVAFATDVKNSVTVLYYLTFITFSDDKKHFRFSAETALADISRYCFRCD